MCIFLTLEHLCGGKPYSLLMVKNLGCILEVFGLYIMTLLANRHNIVEG